MLDLNQKTLMTQLICSTWARIKPMYPIDAQAENVTTTLRGWSKIRNI